MHQKLTRVNIFHNQTALNLVCFQKVNSLQLLGLGSPTTKDNNSDTNVRVSIRPERRIMPEDTNVGCGPYLRFFPQRKTLLPAHRAHRTLFPILIQLVFSENFQLQKSHRPHSVSPGGRFTWLGL